MKAVVIGAGIAGLAAAIRLNSEGVDVTLLTKGIGGLQLSQGSVDILGYAPERVERPLEALAGFAAANHGHPYAQLDADVVRRAVTWFADLLGPDLIAGDPDTNVLLPTAVGALRPTALAVPSVLAGAVKPDTRYLLIGFAQLKDFGAPLAASNLARQGIAARHEIVDFPARAGEVDSSALRYAQALDDKATRRRLAVLLRPMVRDGETVGLPAVLGVNDPGAWKEFEQLLGHPVFEIPLPPPGVPGMRLNQALTQRAKDARVRFTLGARVLGKVVDGDRLVSVALGTAGRTRDYPADAFVFAPGGFESGALELDSYLKVSETILGLPVETPEGEPTVPDYWADQPVFRSGLRVDADMRVGGFSNLYAAGGVLAGAMRWKEKSGEGIALASAMKACDAILEGQR